MTTIFFTIMYQLSNAMSHVCFKKNAEKLRIHAGLEHAGATKDLDRDASGFQNQWEQKYSNTQISKKLRILGMI